MFKQHTSKPFMQVSLALVLSLCSLSAFSEGYRTITFLQEEDADVDKDFYTVTVNYKTDFKDLLGFICMASVSPGHVETIPGGEGQKMTLGYYKTINFCDSTSSKVQLEVRGRKHPEHYAVIWWVKKPGRDPVIYRHEFSKIEKKYYAHDFDNIIVPDTSDPDNIKIWVRYKGEPK